VDCTASGKSLCEKHKVSGYPTIKSFGDGDEDGEDYKGGRDIDALRKHVSTLGPSCSLTNKDVCSVADLAALEKYAGMSQARRDAKIMKLTNAIKKKEAEHEAVQKRLQAEFDASNSAKEKLEEEYKPLIKLMKAATPAAAA